ncbi:MAG: hypothetical protein WCJ35_02195 [Planctomycetota bacterium]
MIDEYVRSELLKKVELLSPPLQQQVLDYTSTLVSEAGKGKKDFLALWGTLDLVAAEEMIRAIEEGCEKVDLDGW